MQKAFQKLKKFLKKGDRSDSSLFAHKTLPKGRWIRLLRLLPGKFGDPIACEIVITQLDQAPPYEPVSYAWGGLLFDHEITCEGLPFFITTNLGQALRRFRDARRPRLLWADGICIDQSSAEEQGHQVALMGEIYSRGHHTLVWLGEATQDENVEAVIDLMKNFNGWVAVNLYRRELEVYNNLSIMDRVVQLPPLDESHDLRRVPAHWDSCKRFFDREWFSRAWVIQEIGLSKKITAFAGQSQVDFTEVVFFVFSAYYSQSNPQMHFAGITIHIIDLLMVVWPTYQANNVQSWMDDHDIIRKLRSFLRERQNDYIPFTSVLNVVRDFDASDDRDHIYALVGHNSAIVENKPIISPDYTVSISTVNRLCAEAICSKTKSLELLCFSQSHTLEHDFTLEEPSWVPQWHTRNVYYENIPNPVFDACLSSLTLSDVVIRVADSRLTVNSLMVDKVIACSEAIDYSNLNDPEAPVGDGPTNAVRMCFDVMARENMPFNTFLDWRDFAWTLVGSSYYFGLDIVPDLMAYCEKYCLTFFKEYLEVHDFLMSEYNARPGNAARFLEAIEGVTTSRVFFITSQGSLGTGHHSVQPGDSVAVVFGCPMPLILRPTDEKSVYSLVGRSIMDKLMTGQAVRQWMFQQSDLEEEKKLEKSLITLV